MNPLKYLEYLQRNLNENIKQDVKILSRGVEICEQVQLFSLNEIPNENLCVWSQWLTWSMFLKPHTTVKVIWPLPEVLVKVPVPRHTGHHEIYSNA